MAGRTRQPGAGPAERGRATTYIELISPALSRRQRVRDEAERVEKEQGYAAGRAFFTAITTDQLTLRAAVDAWLSEVGRSRKQKTAEGHRRVFSALEGFLRERYGLLSLASTTFDDVTRRMAGEFIHWRAG